MTPLEKRIIKHMEGYLSSPTDLYALSANIVKAHGINPTDAQIEEEINLFYNL